MFGLLRRAMNTILSHSYCRWWYECMTPVSLQVQTSLTGVSMSMLAVLKQLQLLSRAPACHCTCNIQQTGSLPQGPVLQACATCISCRGSGVPEVRLCRTAEAVNGLHTRAWDRHNHIPPAGRKRNRPLQQNSCLLSAGAYLLSVDVRHAW